MNITIEEYVAINNPKQADALIRKYGIPPSRSYRDLVAKLRALTKRKKEEAFIELAKIETPYRSLLLSNSEEDNSNACGCSGADGETKSNCAGCGGNCGGMSAVNGTPEEKQMTAKTVSEEVNAINEKSDKEKTKTNYVPIAIAAIGGVVLAMLLLRK